LAVRGLDGAVAAAARQVLDRFGDVAAAFERVRRAEFARQCRAVRHLVDSDNGRLAGKPRGHDRREPDGAGVEHGEADPQRRPQLVEHRSGAGRDAAAGRSHEVVVDSVRPFASCRSSATAWVAQEDCWKKRPASVSPLARLSGLDPSSR
jgi:hypothetical protein